MTIILGDTLIMPMSKSIKVSVKSELPLTGEENEIVLISEVQTENFLISNSDPTASEGDMWIISGEEGEHSIQFGKDSKSKIILLGAQQKTADGWSKLDGYVRVGSEWIQFGRKGMLLKDLPKGTLVNFNKNYPKNRIVEPHPQSPKNVAFLIDNSKKYFDATFNVLNEKEQAIYNELSEIHKYIIEIQLYTCERGFEKLESKNIFTPGAIEMTGVEKYPSTSFKPKQKFWTNDYDATKVLISRDYLNLLNAYVYYNSYVSSVSHDSNYQTQFGVVLDKNTQVSPSPNPDGSYNLII